MLHLKYRSIRLRSTLMYPPTNPAIPWTHPCSAMLELLNQQEEMEEKGDRQTNKKKMGRERERQSWGRETEIERKLGWLKKGSKLVALKWS